MWSMAVADDAGLSGLSGARQAKRAAANASPTPLNIVGTNHRIVRLNSR
jgi:hypothetical protein